MGILINGNKPSKIIYNGVETALYYNGSKIWPEEEPYDPYNPLNLPANTVRVRTSDGNAPIIYGATSYETATLVAGTTDVYDVYKSGTNFRELLRNSTNVVEVLGANTTGIINMSGMFQNTSITTIALFDTSSVTNMSYMFTSCASLTTVPLFNTSSVINMSNMFNSCSSLTTVPLFNTSSATDMNTMFNMCSSLKSIPLFNTSSVTNMSNMFKSCYYVESGALALYQQASTQATPPTNHTSTFHYCGRNTTTGAAELAQIPNDWK